MRASFEPAVTVSPTPIYDALCAEYRRLFRALPGDRSGEEELRFDAFGPTPAFDAFNALGTGRRRLPGERPALPAGVSETARQDRTFDSGPSPAPRPRSYEGRVDPGGIGRRPRYGW